MKKNLLFVLPIVFVISLTSCVNKEITKEEFVALAKQVEENGTFTKATVKCKATMVIDSADEDVVESVDETFSRNFVFTYKNSRWNKITLEKGEEPYTDIQKIIRDSCQELLNMNIKDHLKEEPLSNRKTDGLTFYKNPLTYHYEVEYKDASMKVTDGVTGIVNGEAEKTYRFNNKNGNITYYYENSDTKVKYSIPNYGKMTVHSIGKITASFSYSKK